MRLLAYKTAFTGCRPLELDKVMLMGQGRCLRYIQTD